MWYGQGRGAWPEQPARAVGTHERECLTEHPQGRCPAYGKELFTCGEKYHFSHADICKGKTVRKIGAIKTYSQSVKGITTIKAIDKKSDDNLWVPITSGNATIEMFIDSGCPYTIIPPSYYDQSMGEIIDHDVELRAWGATKLLDTRGMIPTELITKRGVKKTTNVYVVDGFHPEPLLGSADAEDLGFIIINKAGRRPTKGECEEVRGVKRAESNIMQKLRKN